MAKNPPEISEENRTIANSEYHMKNFSHDDTLDYLKTVNRTDIDPEKLYLALNRSTLNLDLINGEIIFGKRCTDEFNEKFKKDLSDISKYTQKLCEILGVKEDGEIGTSNGVKASYPNFDSISAEKPKPTDDLYWAIGVAALSDQSLGENANKLKTSHYNQTYGWPAFDERIKSIGQEINYLRAISIHIRNTLNGDKKVFDSDFYQEKIDYGLTAEQWLIGRKLPEIYEGFFGKNLPISGRTSKEPHGEGIDFLIWCLGRIGLEYKKTTIRDYYYKYRIRTNT